MSAQEGPHTAIIGELAKLRAKLQSCASARASTGPAGPESYDLKLSQMAKEKEELNNAYIALQEQYQAHPEVVNLRQQCQALQVQASHAQQLSAELQALQGQHQTTQTQQAEVANLQQQVISLESECAGLRGLEAEVMRLQQQCQGLEAELINSRGCVDEVQSLRQQCEVLSAQNAQHARNAEELASAQASGQDSQVSRLEHKCQQLESSNNALQADVLRLQEENRTSQAAIYKTKELEAEVGRLTSRCQALEAVEHQRAVAKGGSSIHHMPSSPTSLVNTTGSFLTRTSFGSMLPQNDYSAPLPSPGSATPTRIPSTQPGSTRIIRPSFVAAPPAPQSPISVPMMTVTSQGRTEWSPTPAVGVGGLQSAFQSRSVHQTTVLQR